MRFMVDQVALEHIFSEFLRLFLYNRHCTIASCRCVAVHWSVRAPCSRRTWSRDLFKL
jgi:hypothetical protein